MRELGGDRLRGDRIVRGDVLDREVGEDDAPAERDARRVAFEHLDLVARDRAASSRWRNRGPPARRRCRRSSCADPTRRGHLHNHPGRLESHRRSMAQQPARRTGVVPHWVSALTGRSGVDNRLLNPHPYIANSTNEVNEALRDFFDPLAILIAILRHPRRVNAGAAIALALTTGGVALARSGVPLAGASITVPLPEARPLVLAGERDRVSLDRRASEADQRVDAVPRARFRLPPSPSSSPAMTTTGRARSCAFPRPSITKPMASPRRAARGRAGRPQSRPPPGFREVGLRRRL